MSACMVGGLHFVVMCLSVQLKLISFTVTFSAKGNPVLQWH
jgi:hypothetical protein